MRIMITGGGTGGHTSPALAVMEELQRRDPQLLLQWVGRKGGLEERICKSRGLPFRGVPVAGWPRTRSLRKIWVAAKLAYSVLRCMLYIRKFRPQLVFGVGGYVSLPLGLAAQWLGVPTVLHEQNRLLGMANRLLAKRATRLLLSYPDTLGSFPKETAQIVGNPVRAGFAEPPEMGAARAELGLEPDIPVVLVCGGSQGAHSLNEALAAALEGFAENEAQFVWMTGKADAIAARKTAEESAARVSVFPFIEDMVTACAAADLVVSRSGASTTAELACLGKPSILVPFPHATDNHQEKNARAFEDVGAAQVILDGECNGERLGGAVRGILHAQDRLEAMGQAAAALARPGAAESIVEEIFSLVFEEGRR
jgi:UDP-N-acetylglucosamine--N-acetylmuramyl-(pentapeptide) pyrophosphoryl-undecaprenol N-acetylglucosamine transferase